MAEAVTEFDSFIAVLSSFSSPAYINLELTIDVIPLITIQ